ncbi:putative nucleoside-diphosphate kinase [Tilletiaria anomala UBC 951]|uniref:Nucleoside diphosphate kinase n=1 Tax=Tilletiaria anomala (strain ATCC 24038 / CBS 436.72 / UBC 951) TaxID=1037660 RepID=A0A066VUY7_TILAU|nr:putative nucleoside-diphosphate kinase [Tilletiaria anomala UBC 951]KDN42629.1 putative nucleoside-diphosphate kinase [Tilletiaria anomala UBC 951]
MFARTAASALRGSSLRAMSTAAAQRASSSARRSAAVASSLTAAAGLTFYALSQPSLELEGPKTIAGEYKTVTERSFVMLKPDGTSRQLLGKVINRFEEKGYKLVAIKSLVPSEALAKEHYADLAGRPFYPGLVKYITCGVPVIAMVFEGKDVIRQGRRIVGATNPLEADPGSVRGQYAISVGRNLIHASDGFDSATTEIGLWFSDAEIASYKTANEEWVVSDN